MSDDIVTRLEQEHWCDSDNCNLAQIAADEIERLREENIQYEMAFTYFEDLDEVRLDTIRTASKEMKRMEAEIERLQLLGDMLRNTVIYIYARQAMPEDVEHVVESWEAIRKNTP